MKKIILDTNILLSIYKLKINIFSELERICDFNYQIYVLDKTIKEIKKHKNKKAVKLALEIIKKKNLKVLKSGKGKVDDSLLKLAKKNYIIATQDKELKKNLKNYITIRQKKHLIKCFTKSR